MMQISDKLCSFLGTQSHQSQDSLHWHHMLKTWLQAQINLTAKIIATSLKNRTMYNSKGGCMAAKFGLRGSVQVARSGMPSMPNSSTSNSSTSNSSTASSMDSFIPYEGREKLKI